MRLSAIREGFAQASTGRAAKMKKAKRSTEATLWKSDYAREQGDPTINAMRTPSVEKTPARATIPRSESRKSFSDCLDEALNAPPQEQAPPGQEEEMAHPEIQAYPNAPVPPQQQQVQPVPPQPVPPKPGQKPVSLQRVLPKPASAAPPSPGNIKVPQRQMVNPQARMQRTPPNQPGM